MPRSARVIVPQMPYHIVQRGNRKMPVFFGDEDKREYLRLLKYNCGEFGVSIWAYCLMDNHVHLIAVPEFTHSLSKAIGRTNWNYAQKINQRQGWRGSSLWQGRFLSLLLDQSYLYAAMRYVELNPVAAGLVNRAEDYKWSSARSHVYKTPDPLLTNCFLTEEIPDWADFLSSKSDVHVRVTSGN